MYHIQLTNKNTKKTYSKAKPQIQETKRASERDPQMALMWELSDQEFKTTRISMLRVLLDKVDRMHEHMGDIRIEMKILRKKEKKC